MDKINAQFSSSKEASTLERFQNNIKESFFFLMHILLKNQSQNVWTEMLVIIIEMIQLLAFPFNIIGITYTFYNFLVHQYLEKQ